MIRRPVREKVQYITPDGVKFNLHDPPNKGVYNLDGVGLPPRTYRSVAGPYQHGERVISAALDPRTISFSFRHNGFSRSELWGNRDTLTDILRINRPSDPDTYAPFNNPEPGQLKFFYLQDGELVVRAIDVYLNGGVTYRDSDDIYAIQEDLTFTAYNPLFYDPTPVEVELEVGNNTITYEGNWEEYPTIVVDGTVQNFAIQNTDTLYYMDLQYTSAAAEIITFDLSYGIKDVYNDSGDSLLSYLTLSSNLINFNLQPHPVVEDGENVLQVTLDSGTPTITMTYYNRYLSL